MFHLFIDESGELGSKERSSDFFVITALCTQNPKALEKRLKREKAKLYSAGWPKHIEIKGTTVWGSPHNLAIPRQISDQRVDILNKIISSLVASPISVHYSVARKKHLTANLMRAEYGIAYNYLCGNLLCRAYKDHFRGPLDIIVDQRSKETHSKMKFDGYIETRLVSDCDHVENLSIQHLESDKTLGLQAVDFLSWAIFRKYEHRDPQFREIVLPRIGYRDDWYSWKR